MTERISQYALDEIKRVAGSQSALARLLGLNRQTVNQWYKRGVIPVDRVVSVEAATGVDRSVQRPDLFRRTEQAA